MVVFVLSRELARGRRLLFSDDTVHCAFKAYSHYQYVFSDRYKQPVSRYGWTWGKGAVRYFTGEPIKARRKFTSLCDASSEIDVFQKSKLFFFFTSITEVSQTLFVVEMCYLDVQMTVVGPRPEGNNPSCR